MADTMSAPDKQLMVLSFLEIAVDQTADTARQFLLATSWKLEEAIQLYFAGGLHSSSVSHSSHHNSSGSRTRLHNEYAGDIYEPPAPLPVIHESLYGGARRHYRYDNDVQQSSFATAFQSCDEEMDEEEEEEDEEELEEEEEGTSTNPRSQHMLASLYRPPYDLQYNGCFAQAKLDAASVDKWLIVNVQSNKEFTSHTLNRDTWANEGVAQIIKSNFIFWQVYDHTTEGMKVCTYYKVESTPVTIIIDPITGQKMRLWSGMVHPDPLLEALLPMTEEGPKLYFASLSRKRARTSSPAKLASTSHEVEEIGLAMKGVLIDAKQSASEDIEAPKGCSYPPLPDEPIGDKSLLCRVGFRLPDGRRVQRNFLRSDPTQLMWSFCYNQLGEEERAFQLVQALPGSSNCVEYDRVGTIGESGLSNSMITVVWV